MNLNQPIPEIELNIRALTIVYEPDYIIEDEILTEPFVVLKAKATGRPAWWNGEMGKKKVLRLMQGLKAQMMLAEVFVYAGITLEQYKRFCSVHEAFTGVKVRCKTALLAGVKLQLAQDVLQPGKDYIRARQWILERTQPEIYGRDIGAYTPPPGQATAKIQSEAFFDENGNIIASRQTAEILKQKYGVDPTETTTDGEGDSQAETNSSPVSGV